MTRPFQKHPDLLPAIISWFETNLPSWYIAEDLTGWTYPEKWITIQPTGGSISRIRSGSPRFDVNVYGETKQEAMDGALDAVRCLMLMLNYTHDNAVITNVVCEYPADISDPISERPRFVFDVTLTYRTN
jgi:hypothetical protein